MAVEHIRNMSSEVAELMSSRLGGPRRMAEVDLATMVRRRGAALPRRLRREARLLADAEQQVLQPRLARQLDAARLTRAHRALVGYLRPMGKGMRWQNRALHLGAALALAALLLGGLALFIFGRRGGF